MKKYHLRIWLLSLSLFLLCLTNTAFAKSEQELTHKFISIADIHFDPFLGCPANTMPCLLITKLQQSDYKNWDGIFDQNTDQKMSTFGQDTNYRLLKSMLAEVKKINANEQLSFGLIIGDFLAHDFRGKYIRATGDRTSSGYTSFVQKTMQFLTDQIDQAFPNLSIYPVIGNNDSYTGDYSVIPKGRFLQDTARSWSTLIHEPENRRNLLKTFPEGGYYAVTLPNNPQQRIIVLDSVLFSTHAKSKRVQVAAENQLAWLHQQLVTAAQKKQQILLTFHIPIGIDVYATLKNKLNGITQFWHARYNRAFEHELKEFSTEVKEILPAHIHMDAFQIITLNRLDIPVTFTPAVSPVYGNNPGLKVFNYDPATLKLKNYETYYYPLDKNNNSVLWEKEYSFNQVYQPDCDVCRIAHGMSLIKKDSPLVAEYEKYYSVNNSVNFLEKHWDPYYWCNLRAINLAGYRTCIEG